MATLRHVVRNGLPKLVTKGGKPSCACCGPCCMYFVERLFDGTFSVEDFPEQIDLFAYFENLSGPHTLNLNEVDGEVGDVVYGSLVGERYIRLSPDSYFVGFDAVEPSQACLFTDQFVNPPTNNPNFSEPPFFFGEGTPPNVWVWVVDKFADRYEATCAGGTYILTRESQCQWLARDGGSVLARLSFESSPSQGLIDEYGSRASIWQFNGSPRTDAGPYNSPAGTYGTCTVVAIEDE